MPSNRRIGASDQLAQNSPHHTFGWGCPCSCARPYKHQHLHLYHLLGSSMGRRLPAHPSSRPPLYRCSHSRAPSSARTVGSFTTPPSQWPVAPAPAPSQSPHPPSHPKISAVGWATNLQELPPRRGQDLLHPLLQLCLSLLMAIGVQQPQWVTAQPRWMGLK